MRTGPKRPGFPHAGTYVGADAIFANVCERLASEWEGYQATVHTYLADGDDVGCVPGDLGAAIVALLK